MVATPPIITLLTDFGESDGYVGVMKGVILGIAPDVKLVDISHQVGPQAVQQAASLLSGVYTYFPPHTVHLVVVDPGVGGTRRPIALETPRGRFVAPDNGVLAYIQQQEPDSIAVVLENQRYWRPTLSHTFHGRDIFSPVAAHLANGVALREFGPACDDLVKPPIPAIEIAPGLVRGEVLRIDHFGNALTNIARLRWVDEQAIEFCPIDPDLADDTRLFDASSARVMFGWHTLNGIHQSYGQVSVGQALALVGSGAELEISVNQSSAQSKLALQVGDSVTLHMHALSDGG